MNCKVSILIPVYNREKFIGECIKSALDQSYDDFEVVVVDNASEDRTWEICQKFATTDLRVRVFRNKSNIGPVKNWQRCAQEAKGEFSKILFSDDLLEPDCLSEMLANWDHKDIGFVFCSAKIGLEKDNTKLAYSLRGNSLIEAKRYCNLVLTGKAPVSPGAVLLRTIDLKENLRINFPTAIPHTFGNNGAGPDVMIMLLTALQYRFVKHLDKGLVFFRAHPGSFTISDSSGSVRSNYEYMTSYYLHRHESWISWMKYLSSRFVRKILSDGPFFSPRLFLRDREGKGAYHEVVILFLLIPFIVIKSLSRKCTAILGRYSVLK
tara:strand:- start:1220 stop:2185 length:966 start_codon:yes stop_codon:yes gene_type:complete